MDPEGKVKRPGAGPRGVRYELKKFLTSFIHAHTHTHRHTNIAHTDTQTHAQRENRSGRHTHTHRQDKTGYCHTGK